MTDNWMDDRSTVKRTHRKKMLLSHTFTMRGSDIASSVEFRSVVVEEIS